MLVIKKLFDVMKELKAMEMDERSVRNAFITYVLKLGFDKLQDLLNKKGCTGVYFVMKSSQNGLRTIFSTMIGEILEDKLDSYEIMANKKIAFLYPLFKYGEPKHGKETFLASKQFRDPAVQEWGGAVRSDDCFSNATYFSVSGHFENGDEALSVVAFLATKMLEGEEVFYSALKFSEIIFRTTNNDLGNKLVKEVFLYP